jgi:hypothetical protein
MGCPTNVAPPFCCAPPMSPEVWAERGRRLEAARSAALAAQPKSCPQCGGDNITPAFPDPVAWECWDCPNVWEA